MPNNDPCDKFVHPYLTLKSDSYILIFALKYILKAKSNFTLFIYIHFQDICKGYMKSV